MSGRPLPQPISIKQNSCGAISAFSIAQWQRVGWHGSYRMPLEKCLLRGLVNQTMPDVLVACALSKSSRKPGRGNPRSGISLIRRNKRESIFNGSAVIVSPRREGQTTRGCAGAVAYGAREQMSDLLIAFGDWHSRTRNLSDTRLPQRERDLERQS